MSNVTEVYIIVEGVTEQTFIREILAPEIAHKSIYLRPVLIGKPGHKGGNIRFERAKKDIEHFLKQRQKTYVSTMLDFYGLNTQWPGRMSAGSLSWREKVLRLEEQTAQEISKLLPELDTQHRFIPYFSMHEFESLLFSDPSVLAEKISISIEKILPILAECDEPENINDQPQTTPSKRIANLSPFGFKKTTNGIAIAQAIGIRMLREKCSHFNEWVTKLEQLTFDSS